MGGACTAARMERSAEFSELKSKKKLRTVKSFGKRKKGVDSDEILKSPIKNDPDEFRFSFSGELLPSTAPRKSGDSKKGSFLGKAGIAGLERAVDVLDVLGSGVANLNSSGFISGLNVRGNRISVLSFEVANTVTKGANLMQSLSDENVRHVKQKVFSSEGVKRLVSTDNLVLQKIAAADKREELDVLCREVVRFGNLCKDPQWHNLDRLFAKMDSEIALQRPLKDDAELKMHELTYLAQQTAELYHELNILDRFEQDYRQKREEAESLNLPCKGESFTLLQTELRHQKKLVMSLKRKSLWSKRLEEVVEKLVDVVLHIHQKIMQVFGNTDIQEVIEEPEEAPERLGVAGLALHYANLINQIDNIASRPSCIPPNTRDSLYRGLPTKVKTALRSSLRRSGSDKETPVPQIKAEMEKILEWLVPMASCTSKMYQGFGWVGEWANSSTDICKQTATSRVPIRLQTLYHAEKSKTDAFLLDLVKLLHRLTAAAKRPDHHLVSSLPTRIATQKQINNPTPIPTSPQNLSPEEMTLLERVGKAKPSSLLASKSHEFIGIHRRSFKIRVGCRSTESSPCRDEEEDDGDWGVLNRLDIAV